MAPLAGVSSEDDPGVVRRQGARWNAGRDLLYEAFVRQISPGTRLRFLAAVILALLVSTLLVLAPVLFSSAVDLLAGCQDTAGAVTLIGASVALFACAKLLLEQRWLVYQPAENRLLNAVRSLYFQHILALPVTFHIDRSIGKLDSIVGQGIGGLQSLCSTVFTQAAPLVFEFLAVVVAAATFLSVEIASVIFITIVSYVAALVCGAERVSRRFHAALNASVAAQGQAADAILNAEGVKTLAIEEAMLRRYNRSLQVSHGAFRNFYRERGVFGLVLSSVLVSGFAIALSLALVGVVGGRFSVGDLVLTHAYLLQLFRSIESFGFAYRDARQSFTAFVRFVDLFVEPREDDRGWRPVPDRIDRISVNQAGFEFPDGRRALERTSLVIENGKITALIGESGSGKSTLVRLLLKLLPLSEGSIAINGIPIAELDTRTLRRKMAIVPQDAIMFGASLAFNVALIENPDPERLRRSLEAARLSGFVQRLAEGVETEIGERGFKLSGGERQRLAIARALYREPQVLILDEATSALDEATRDELLMTMRELGRNYATLIITHDPAVAAIADGVVKIAPPGISEPFLKPLRDVPSGE